MRAQDTAAIRPQIGAARVWLLAARPRTLPAAVAPVLVGTALAIAHDAFHAPAALAALAVALLLQVAANLANDAFDFRRGADTGERVGPLRVTQSGLLSYRAVLLGTGLVTLIAVAAGLYLVGRGGWPLLLLGALAVLAMLAYTGGPFPLGYHGLGELAVFIFFGLLGVGGSYYVQAGELPGRVVVAALPVGCLIAAILVVNNLRDIATDARAGKRTLAVRLGRRGTLIEFAALLAAAYLFPPLMWMTGGLSPWWALTWLSLLLAWRLLGGVRAEHGAALNRRLAQTAQLALVYCALFTLAIIL